MRDGNERRPASRDFVIENFFLANASNISDARRLMQDVATNRGTRAAAKRMIGIMQAAQSVVGEGRNKDAP